VTTPKSPKKRKSSVRARPKRVVVSAAKAGPAAVQSVHDPAVVPPVSAAVVSSMDADAVPASIPAATAAVSAAAVAGICVQLEAGLEIKDVEGVHRLLSAALGDGRAITVDVGRVHAVDTAGAQLLIAFQSEAVRCGVAVEFRGGSPTLTRALGVLGLHDKFTFAAPDV